MTDSGNSANWDSIRKTAIPPATSAAATTPHKPTVSDTQPALTRDAGPPAGLPTGSIASITLPIGTAAPAVTDVAVKAEITAKASEFNDLAAATDHLKLTPSNAEPTGKTPAAKKAAKGVSPTIDPTVRTKCHTRTGQLEIQEITIGWLSQYQQLHTRPKPTPGGTPDNQVDHSYGNNVNQMVDVSDSIIAELRFLQNASGVEGSTYRSLAAAVETAKQSPADHHALLALYGELITFVQVVRQGGQDGHAGFQTFLQDNFDAFSQGSSRTGGVANATQAILQDLGVSDVASLQRDKLGMTGKDANGIFGAQTYFQTQLFVLEQMARNLSRRDGLGMAAMQMSVADAKASVDRLTDLTTNFGDRLKQHTISSATQSYLETQGYKVSGAGLVDTTGKAVNDKQLGELSQKWLAQATYMAQKSHQDVQDAMALHGAYLTNNQRKQVNKWVHAYECFYIDTMARGTTPVSSVILPGPATDPVADHATKKTPAVTPVNGTAPNQPDVTEAMAVVALEQVAVNESKQPPKAPGTADHADETQARHERGAEVMQTMEAFYTRLKGGIAIDDLTVEERHSVASLSRHGYVRAEGTKVFLSASEDELKSFGEMAETFTNPESEHVAAIMDTMVKAFVQIHTVAALKEDILGVVQWSSEIGTLLAGLPNLLPQSAVVVGHDQAAPDEQTPVKPPVDTTPEGDTPDEADAPTPAVAAHVPTAHQAAPPPTLNLLTDWPDEVQTLHEDRQHRAETRRQEAIEAYQADTDAIQAKGRERTQEQRRQQQATSETVVRGADGQAVGTIRNADGDVIGVKAAADPAKVPG